MDILSTSFLILSNLYLVYGGQPSFTNYVSYDIMSNLTDFSSILFSLYEDGTKSMSFSEYETFYNCTIGIDHCSRNFSMLSDIAKLDCIPGNGNNICTLLHKCATAKNVLSVIRSNNNIEKAISEEEFKILLPIVTYQAQGQFCSQHHDTETPAKLPSSAEVWGYGFLFVTLISSCSLAGVSVLPLMAKGYYQKLLTLLVGLAAGSLVASSVFHLIPQAFAITKNPDGNHDYLFISLGILIGIWSFFMIERFISIALRRQTHIKRGVRGSISSQQIVESSKYCSNNATSNYKENNDSVRANGQVVESSTNDGSCNVTDVQMIMDSQVQVIKASFGHEQKPEHFHNHDVVFKKGEDSAIATVAWMIIFGDGFHNFIDGVSIGAAFQQSILTGISISLAVLCEELPHELGDFAVLLNSGMTMKQALSYNFLSATTCYLGMFVGILLGEFTQDSTYIFALAGGMFLYIALVDMLPEMRETAEQSMKTGMKDLISVLILQNIGMIIGVLILFFLAYYQNEITFE